MSLWVYPHCYFQKMFVFQICKLSSFWILPCLSQNGKISGPYPAKLPDLSTLFFTELPNLSFSHLRPFIITGQSSLPPDTSKPRLLVSLASCLMYSKAGIICACILEHTKYLSIQIWQAYCTTATDTFKGWFLTTCIFTCNKWLEQYRWLFNTFLKCCSSGGKTHQSLQV